MNAMDDENEDMRPGPSSKHSSRSRSAQNVQRPWRRSNLDGAPNNYGNNQSWRRPDLRNRSQSNNRYYQSDTQTRFRGGYGGVGQQHGTSLAAGHYRQIQTSNSNRPQDNNYRGNNTRRMGTDQPNKKKGDRNGQQSYNRAKFIGFQTLEEIAHADEKDIIVKINEKRNAFMELINTPIAKLDIFVLVVEIISKICQSSFDELKLKLLLDICNSQFIGSLKIYMAELPDPEIKSMNSLYWSDQNGFWTNFVTFCECIVNTSPTTALAKCRSLIDSISKSCLEGLAERHDFKLSDEHVSKMTELRERLKSFEKGNDVGSSATKRSKSGYCDNIQPPEDFRTLSLVPNRDDLLEQRPFLRPNIVDGGYQDVEHYLDVQFRLLREDCFGPLREGILQFVGDPDKRKYDHIRVFRNVKFIKPYISQTKAGSVVQIDINSKDNRNFKRINWANSKRFIFGSLVMFTKDNCNTFIAATILDRDPKALAEGKIPVSIIDEVFDVGLYNSDDSYTMIESEVYFEPYFHVMKALQDPTFPTHLAMQQYIVKVDPTPQPPTYLSPDDEYIITNEVSTVGDIHSNLAIASEISIPEDMIIEMHIDRDTNDQNTSPPVKFKVLDEKTWPSKEDLGFNDSQYEAYRMALTHQFAVIQGPPGTGKTYLGINVAKAFIQNLSKIEGCLMLVICYTNHALDQFLEAILKLTPSVVRIGGQSRNKVMEDINLTKLRLEEGYDSAHKLFLEQRFALKTFVAYFQKTLIQLDALCNGVIKYQCIKDDVPEIKILGNNYGSGKNDPLMTWLFENTHAYYTNFDDCLLDEEYVVNENIEEEIRKRTDFVMDDDKYNIDEQALLEGKEMLSFSLSNAKDILRLMISNYKKSNNPQEKNNLQSEIEFLKASINLYQDMCVHKTRRIRLPINNRTNFSRIHPIDRWTLYFSWMKPTIDEMKKKVGNLQAELTREVTAFEESRMVADMQILTRRRVVGMTTSGAARMRKLLQALATPIVIVEEAAEVLEQHIVSSLTRHCQHLILIGDHQQLRPSASHVKLARHYGLEVSLFERMITSGVHSRRLAVQHRMRPELAALIAPHIYADLRNHASVCDLPDVRGLSNNLFFFDHQFMEEEDIQEGSSRSNHKEADMVLGLANYLIQQGYLAEDVTILAAYSGQMFYMKKERQNYPHLIDVKITVVDNYQGEESKIILLSLVRNNSQNKIGFLGIENRICVALSRAKEGFYIFGNMNTLKSNSELWQKIAATLENNNSLGTEINLKCQNHPTQITAVSNSIDFTKVPEGGCLLKCDKDLPRCGHKCLLFCHGYDRDHRTPATECTRDCERILCDLGHVCPHKCAAECGPCRKIMAKDLPCGHTMNLFCYQEPEDPTVKCPTYVSVTLPDCGHEVMKPCHMDIKNVRCTVHCEYRVEPCGHQCLLKCHVKYDPHHEKYRCGKACAKAKKGCSTELLGDRGDHQCLKKCYEDCDDCNVQVSKKRTTCKHTVLVACSQNPDVKPCQIKCARSLPCTHFCKKMCSDKCGDCTEMVKKVIPGCKHEVQMACKMEATRELCTEKCEKEMSCGHICRDLCGKICDPKKCPEMVANKLESACGHVVDTIPCHISVSLAAGGVPADVVSAYCSAACGQQLVCGHECGGTCARCHRGRLHAPCAQPCRRINICGHECKEPCNQVCPPCKARCEVKCPHSRCRKQCGEPCVPCQEKCDRKCPHGACGRRCGEPCGRAACSAACKRRLRCGHACRGLCGEPCPDVCRTCRPDTFPTGFLGEEYDDDDKFIQLQDCGHVLELENMDNLMMGDQETVQIRKCPLCRKPIVNTYRYKDLVNDTFKTEINPIKDKVYGTDTQIKQKRMELVQKINAFQRSHEYILRGDNKLWIDKFLKLVTVVRNQRKSSLLQLEMQLVYLNILDMIAECYKKYIDRHSTELKEELNKQINLICEVLIINKNTAIAFKISQQQQKDAGNEIKRLNSIVQLSLILSDVLYKNSQTAPEVSKAAEEAKAAALSATVYNEDATVEALQRLQKSINISGFVSKHERELIVKAIGLSAGHWYKCPKGHFYAIGQCGGAMETSKCPECGATIGGGSHRLEKGNAHAPEMDGSRFPAWSEEYNNMANFRLD